MQELIHNLGINGKLLLAQAVNFLLLLWLLNRFVFQKIFASLEKRRQEIEKGIALKAKAEQDLSRIGVLERETLNQARGKAEQVLSGAAQRAQEVEKGIILKAREKEEQMLRDARKRAENEREELMQEAQGRISSLAFLAAEKVLAKTLTKKEKERLLKESFGNIRKDADT